MDYHDSRKMDGLLPHQKDEWTTMTTEKWMDYYDNRKMGGLL